MPTRSSLQDEYAAICEGMRLGTLRPKPPERKLKTWITKRYSNTNSGESFDARIPSSRVYSLGKTGRLGREKVWVSNEVANRAAHSALP